MDKKVICSASHYAQKYYFSPEFNGIPAAIKNEIKEICIITAEKLRGIFTMGFYENGEIFFEVRSEGNDYNFDDIGAPLEIKRIELEKKELLKALKLWYKFFMTEEGRTIIEKMDERNNAPS